VDLEFRRGDVVGFHATTLRDDIPRLHGDKQPVRAIGEPRDVEALTFEIRRINVGPAYRDALNTVLTAIDVRLARDMIETQSGFLPRILKAETDFWGAGQNSRADGAIGPHVPEFVGGEVVEVPVIVRGVKLKGAHEVRCHRIPTAGSVVRVEAL